MDIEQLFINVYHQLFPVTIWNWSYVGQLWTRYANFWGFITGAAVIAMMYFASEMYGGLNLFSKNGLMRVFALVAFINSMDNLYIIVANLFVKYVLHLSAFSHPFRNGAAYNPFAIMLFCLVIKECYSDESLKTFFFGISTFGVAQLMFGTGFNSRIAMFYVFARVIVAGVLSIFLGKCKYLYVSYFFMSVFYLLSETGFFYLMRIYHQSTDTASEVIKTLIGNYTVDYLLIGGILVFWIVFERAILRVQNE